MIERKHGNLSSNGLKMTTTVISLKKHLAEMVLNALPQRHEHFVVQESFNPAETFERSACTRVRNKLNFSSRVVQKQHELLHTKTNSVLILRSKEGFRLIRRGELFFLTNRKENKQYFSNISGGTRQAKLWHKRLVHLNFREVANTTDNASHASNF